MSSDQVWNLLSPDGKVLGNYQGSTASSAAKKADRRIRQLSGVKSDAPVDVLLRRYDRVSGSHSPRVRHFKTMRVQLDPSKQTGFAKQFGMTNTCKTEYQGIIPYSELQLNQ